MKADLQAILLRLEEATGADRETDALCQALAENREVRWDGNMMLGRSRAAPHDECVLGSIDPGRVARNFNAGYSNPPFPAFTASIDCALSLVERVLPGWEIELTSEHRDDAVIWRMKLGDPLRGMDGESPVPAIAVLQAMVRALIQKEKLS